MDLSPLAVVFPLTGKSLSRQPFTDLTWLPRVHSGQEPCGRNASPRLCPWTVWPAFAAPRSTLAAQHARQMHHLYRQLWVRHWLHWNSDRDAANLKQGASWRRTARFASTSALRLPAVSALHESCNQLVLAATQRQRS